MPVAKRKIGKKKVSDTTIFQLKISLRGAPVPIWRRIAIRANVPLSLVHEVLQITMGWWNEHLYEFQANGKRFGELDSENEDVEDADTFSLTDLIGKVGDTFTYIYDFGDDWHHDVVLEDIIETQQSGLAACVAGKRACPPEDIGGVGGYLHFLNIIEDPHHAEYVQMVEWVGGGFDADCFDMRGVNFRLILLEQELLGMAEAQLSKPI